MQLAWWVLNGEHKVLAKGNHIVDFSYTLGDSGTSISKKVSTFYSRVKFPIHSVKSTGFGIWLTFVCIPTLPLIKYMVLNKLSGYSEPYILIYNRRIKRLNDGVYMRFYSECLVHTKYPMKVVFISFLNLSFSCAIFWCQASIFSRNMDYYPFSQNLVFWMWTFHFFSMNCYLNIFLI